MSTPTMTDAERRLFREEGIVPEGWRWCPDCNGEGRISTMDANPDLTEHEFDCDTCVAEQGIVPIEPATIEELIREAEGR